MKKKASSLWVKSPCTIGFPQRNIAFQKVQRFSVNSIYYKEPFRQRQAQKIEILQPEKYLVNFRRQIQQCEKQRKKFSRNWRSMSSLKNNSFIGTSSPKYPKTTKKKEVVQRLTPKSPLEMDTVFDKNGNRSTFYTSIGQNILRYAFKKSKSVLSFERIPVSGPKVYVSGTIRMDLSRPQNFNPGPGSYFIDKKDTQQISSIFQKSLKTSTRRSRKSVQFNFSSTIQPQEQDFRKPNAQENNLQKKKSKLVKFRVTEKQKVNFKCSYEKKTL